METTPAFWYVQPSHPSPGAFLGIYNVPSEIASSVSISWAHSDISFYPMHMLYAICGGNAARY